MARHLTILKQVHVDKEAKPAQFPEDVGPYGAGLVRVRVHRPGAVKNLVQDQLQDFLIDAEVGVVILMLHNLALKPVWAVVFS